MNASAQGNEFLVVDTGDAEDRPLAESVRGAGFVPRLVSSIEELEELLTRRPDSVAVIRFEALWPQPQPRLRALRDAAPDSKLLIVHAANSARVRLGQRLWAAGLCDQFFPIDSSQPTVTRILRHAHAGKVMDTDAATAPPKGKVPTASVDPAIRVLYEIVSGFGGHETIEGLLRELQISLPRMVAYHVFQVMIADRSRYSLSVSPIAPVPHDIVWELAKRTCQAASPFVPGELEPEHLVFLETPPLGMADDDDQPVVDDDHVEVLPMVLHGEFVGCLTLLLKQPRAVQPAAHNLLQLLAVQLSSSVRNLQRLDAARRDAMLDELTGAHNRRYLQPALRREWQRAGRYGFRLSIGILDVDDFKDVNDRFGHLVGDEVLKNLAQTIRGQLRETDHFIRYGGDEFLILFPETGPSEAALVMERIRLQLQHSPLYRDDESGDLHLSISAGVAAYPECRPGSPEALLDRADAAAMEAKSAGRDSVWIASEDELQPAATNDPRRQSPRVSTQIPVRYMEIPHFDATPVRMTAANLSAGGAGLKGPRHELKRNAYGLLYVAGDTKPVLSQIMWTRDLNEHETMAGLRFVRPDELERRRMETIPMFAMKTLVVAEHDRTRAMVERVLRAANVQADFVSAPDELARLESLKGYSMVVVGESSMRSALGERLRDLRKVPLDYPVRIVVLNESGDRRATLEAISRERVSHLVGGRAGQGDESLFATLNKIFLGEHFGIDKYLMWGADTRIWTVSTPEEKGQVLEQVRLTAHAMRCHPRIADLLVAATDEMIINALYRRTDEPAQKDATQGHRCVTVECGSDGRLFAIAVIDDLGLFEPDNMFDAIGRALEWEDKGLPETASHAHLGFKIMLSGLSQLVVNVHPGRCTEVIGITDLRKSLRELRTEAPGLGLFQSDG